MKLVEHAFSADYEEKKRKFAIALAANVAPGPQFGDVNDFIGSEQLQHVATRVVTTSIGPTVPTSLRAFLVKTFRGNRSIRAGPKIANVY